VEAKLFKVGGSQAVRGVVERMAGELIAGDLRICANSAFELVFGAASSLSIAASLTSANEGHVRLHGGSRGAGPEVVRVPFC
jgi:hypothetical protein